MKVGWDHYSQYMEKRFQTTNQSGSILLNAWEAAIPTKSTLAQTWIQSCHPIRPTRFKKADRAFPHIYPYMHIGLNALIGRAVFKRFFRGVASPPLPFKPNVCHCGCGLRGLCCFFLHLPAKETIQRRWSSFLHAKKRKFSTLACHKRIRTRLKSSCQAPSMPDVLHHSAARGLRHTIRWQGHPLPVVWEGRSRAIAPFSCLQGFRALAP